MGAVCTKQPSDSSSSRAAGERDQRELLLDPVGASGFHEDADFHPSLSPASHSARLATAVYGFNKAFRAGSEFPVSVDAVAAAIASSWMTGLEVVGARSGSLLQRSVAIYTGTAHTIRKGRPTATNHLKKDDADTAASNVASLSRLSYDSAAAAANASALHALRQSVMANVRRAIPACVE